MLEIVNALIHKQPIPVGDRFSLLLPRGARILSVQVQREGPVLWYCFAEEELNYTERRFFRLAGTGIPFHGGSLEYLGTFQIASFVGHLFEEIK